LEFGIVIVGEQPRDEPRKHGRFDEEQRALTL
jgi:hypothetical protein